MKKFKFNELLLFSLFCFSILAVGYPINVDPINIEITIIQKQVNVYADNPKEK